jgi:penicillin amidase
MSWFFKSICAILILLIAILIVLQHLTNPIYTGAIHHTHQNIGDISIYRDKYAIPHIKGDDYTDVMYGLGYVHAQDRLWSMHMKRRLSAGRLSEFAGSETLLLDKFFRSLSLHITAEQTMTNLSPL